MRRNKKQEIEIRNQRICEALVRREVVYCVSSLVSHFAQNDSALDGSDYHRDDLMRDLLAQDDWEQPACDEIHGWDAEQCQEYLDERGVEYSKRLGVKKLVALALDAADDQGWDEFCADKRLDPHENEAFEHWIVTGWFARKLGDHGEIVGELFGMDIWGRCTSGQSISVDGVIRSIANGMEILVGQKNEWRDS